MVLLLSSFSCTSFLPVKSSLPLSIQSSLVSNCQLGHGIVRKTLNDNNISKLHHRIHQEQLHLVAVKKKTKLGMKIKCRASEKFKNINSEETQDDDNNNNNNNNNIVLQLLLWTAEGVYIVWLFILPFAPGDPVWAISQDTINSLVGFSLNFFFILPLMNSIGIHVLESPVIHTMEEGLFNFVIGWTLMFAPLLFTDRKRNRFKGSLDVLWGFQMFLTNTFLMPYMAIRLNKADTESSPKEPSKLEAVMVDGAPVVGLIGGAVCTLCLVWACFGRMDGNFGILTDRWEYFLSYLGSDRVGYAFIWDSCLYTVFQPWLIGDNIDNVKESSVNTVEKLRFVPVVGLAAYLLSLDPAEEL
ncbi:uncharacterized protein LOC113331742 [Papaver somniferum]|uniref:uncharacterized protein LOC113331742 n=1 Tax=Papaver somniferum TaxID=3469 RepID=UPI000E6F765E|nr:uncharacterized protein LOC113331742 [Papaver somniferum]